MSLDLTTVAIHHRAPPSHFSFDALQSRLSRWGDAIRAWGTLLLSRMQTALSTLTGRVQVIDQPQAAATVRVQVIDQPQAAATAAEPIDRIISDNSSVLIQLVRLSDNRLSPIVSDEWAKHIYFLNHKERLSPDLTHRKLCEIDAGLQRLIPQLKEKTGAIAKAEMDAGIQSYNPLFQSRLIEQLMSNQQQLASSLN
jgi:hypothetical protein